MVSNKNHSEMLIAGQVKKLRLAKGMSQKVFAESLGIVQGYLSGIERGHKIPSQTLLVALCHVHGVSEEWLFGEDDAEVTEQARLQKSYPGSVTTDIPLLKSIHEGFPGKISQEEICGHISLPDIFTGCYAIIVDGDFMAPTIRDRDLIIFKPDGAIDNRSIVLMNNKWGEVIMRRYRVRGKEVFFSSESLMYPPFKADSDTRIFGVVVDIWRRVKI